MSSMLWALCYPNYRVRSLAPGSEPPSESDCGLTDKHSYTEDPWADFGTSTASGESETTPPTKSSLNPVTQKHDPAHYQRGRIQVWDFIVDQQLDFLAGNVIKYVCRAGHKNHESELDDWLKVKAYVDRKIAAIQQTRNR
jgi:hypothetical protein